LVLSLTSFNSDRIFLFTDNLDPEMAEILDAEFQKLTNKLISLQFPKAQVFRLPAFTAPPDSPFSPDQLVLNKIYFFVLNGEFPLVFALSYFILVHVCNSFIRKRQLRLANSKGNFEGSKLPAAPFFFTKGCLFRNFVLLHNIFLCIYSVWTFIGMSTTIHEISNQVLPSLFASSYSQNLEGKHVFQFEFPKSELFWQSICDLDNGIWFNNKQQNLKGLSFYSFWFYISKFYEIVDTFIILLKGRPSSLLQSYHHAGAMISMWAGVRFASPPIWIFVVFNSFIHSVMYFYFTLSCLKVRVPKALKQLLTTMQIIQFVAGGSLATFHLFINYYDMVDGIFKPCIPNADKAMALFINVAYLTPLTMLFAVFWIESYARKKSTVFKKDQ